MSRPPLPLSPHKTRRHLSGRPVGAATWLVALILAGTIPCVARGQLFPTTFELSADIQLDEIDSAARTQLERVRATIAEKQWDEAVESLRSLIENQGARLVAVRKRRYINLAQYCQLEISALPTQGLELYRRRVDPLAKRWLTEGTERHDMDLLTQVVDQMFCSTYGDDALLALGDLALEQGDYGKARGYWLRLFERPPEAFGVDQLRALTEQLALDERRLVETWYPMPPATMSTATSTIPASTATKAVPANGEAANEALSEPQARLRSEESLPDDVSARLVRAFRSAGYVPVRLAYPGTDLDLAAVRARLVLASLLEGSIDRAAGELAALRRMHPQAQGRLAGRSGDLAETLGALLTTAASWPRLPASDDWLTFAGTAARNGTLTREIDLGDVAWPAIPLGPPLSADVANRAIARRRVGEDSQALLSVHPVVAGDLVLYCNESRIYAFNRHTGQSAWPRDPKLAEPGEIYRDTSADMASRPRTPRMLGVPRFTLTVHQNKLLARMGPQITSRPIEAAAGSPGTLVCLDLAAGAQGKRLWELPVGQARDDAERWAFEGAPIAHGDRVYVAIRKGDVRPQALVACLDLNRGVEIWRTLVCSAETVGGGQTEELTHNLLTYAEGTIFYNTNLGAVAAIDARGGRMRWAALYPRAKKSVADGQERRALHFFRDLNPCVFYRGLLVAAPADCDGIVGLDAASGQIVWQTDTPEDAIHLLGVVDDNLIATGDRVWWIDVRTGKVKGSFPEGNSPRGRGRGLLAGQTVLWPTPDAIFVLSALGPDLASDPIPLPFGRGAGGGNLVVAGDLTVLATAEQLIGFQNRGANNTGELATNDQARTGQALKDRAAKLSTGAVIKRSLPTPVRK